jgi:hypothetical protein
MWRVFAFIFIMNTMKSSRKALTDCCFWRWGSFPITLVSPPLTRKKERKGLGFRYQDLTHVLVQRVSARTLIFQLTLVSNASEDYIIYTGFECLRGLYTYVYTVNGIENPKIWESNYLIIVAESPMGEVLFFMRVTGTVICFFTFLWGRVI